MYETKFKEATIRYYNMHKNNTNFRVADIRIIFNIAISTFYNWLSQYKNTNQQIQTATRKKINKITPEITNYIVNSFTRLKYTSAKNVSRNIRRIFDVNISRSYLYYILKKEKITHKHCSYVKWPYSENKLINEKNRLRQELHNLNDTNIISFDESSVEINMKNNYGWSKRGKPCLRRFYAKRRFRVTLALAISREKIVGYKVVNGSFDSSKFKDFLQDTIYPKYNNSKILLDNSSIHKSQIIKESISKTTNKFVFNIPCFIFN